MASCFLLLRFLRSCGSEWDRKIRPFTRLTLYKDASQSPHFPAFQKYQKWKSGHLTLKNMYILTVRGKVKETEAEARVFR